jgi:hypothetical protein
MLRLQVCNRLPDVALRRSAGLDGPGWRMQRRVRGSSVGLAVELWPVPATMAGIFP